MKEQLGDAFQPPSVDSDFAWEREIEIKLSTISKLATAAAAGAGVAIFLTVVQGRMVINVSKATRGIMQLLEGVNFSTNGVPNNDTSEASRVSYTKPARTVDTSKMEPVNEAELAELRDVISFTNPVEAPEGEVF